MTAHIWTPEAVPVGTLVLADYGVGYRRGTEGHTVVRYHGPHVLSLLGEGRRNGEAGSSPCEWSRATGRSRWDSSRHLLRVATLEDVADHRLACATSSARTRMTTALDRRSPVAAVLEMAELVHWLEGGES